MKKLFKLLLTIAKILCLLAAGPWVLIWSINTLVLAGGVIGFHIPFTIWTWLAGVFIGGFAIIPSFRRS